MGYVFRTLQDHGSYVPVTKNKVLSMMTVNSPIVHNNDFPSNNIVELHGSDNNSNDTVETDACGVDL